MPFLVSKEISVYKRLLDYKTWGSERLGAESGRGRGRGGGGIHTKGKIG